jgi:hypothetical protein
MLVARRAAAPARTVLCVRCAFWGRGGPAHAETDTCLRGQYAAASAALNLKETLDVPVARPSTLPVKGRAPELGTTVLPNGVILAAQETYGPVATVAVAVSAGSRYETRATIGAAQALKHFGFRSTAHRSPVRFAREIETMGGTLTTTATRELVLFVAEVLRDRVPDAVDVLTDVVRATRFADHEVEDVAALAQSESLAVRVCVHLCACTGIEKADAAHTHTCTQAQANPEIRVLEALHRTAFRTTLGNALYPDPADAGHVGADVLRQFFYTHAVAPRLALVGKLRCNLSHTCVLLCSACDAGVGTGDGGRPPASGVGVADLQTLAQKGLGGVSGTAPAVEKAVYQGGDARIEAFRDPVSRYAPAPTLLVFIPMRA